MDAIYLINKKTNDIVLFKEYNIDIKPDDIVKKFLNNLNKNNNELINTPYILINDIFCLYYPLKDIINNKTSDLFYLLLTHNIDLYLPSYANIFKLLNNIIYFGLNNQLDVNLIFDNVISIILMIEHYTIDGIPVINDEYVLQTILNPNRLTDKISENIIGISKTYNVSGLNEYINNIQLNNKPYLYKFSDYSTCEEIYFDFIDYVEFKYDKDFNILSNKTYSEIRINSDIESNAELNILMNIPFEIISMSMDECITTKRKDFFQKKTIDCLCKHGNFTLMNFLPKINNSYIQLPFKIFSSKSITNNILDIKLGISLQRVKDILYPLNDLEIKIKFVCNDTIFKNNDLSPNLGEFIFDTENSEGIWKIKIMENENNDAVLKGHLSMEGNYQNNNCILIVNLCGYIEKFSLSGGKLVKVNLSKKDEGKIKKFYKNKTIINNLEIII